MDYIVGFLLGYYTPRFFSWLKKLAEVKLPDNFTQEDWDWLDTNDKY